MYTSFHFPQQIPSMFGHRVNICIRCRVLSFYFSMSKSSIIVVLIYTLYLMMLHIFPCGCRLSDHLCDVLLTFAHFNYWVLTWVLVFLYIFWTVTFSFFKIFNYNYLFCVFGKRRCTCVTMYVWMCEVRGQYAPFTMGALDKLRWLGLAAITLIYWANSPVSKLFSLKIELLRIFSRPVACLSMKCQCL